MHTKPTTFEEALKALGTPTATARALGVPYVTAQMMHKRKSVGVTHWLKLIDALGEQGIHITADDLLAMKQRKSKVDA